MSISTRTLTDDYSLDLNLFNWNNIFLPSFLNIDHQSGSLAWDATSLLILNCISFTVTVEQYMINCNSTHLATKNLHSHIYLQWYKIRHIGRCRHQRFQPYQPVFLNSWYFVIQNKTLKDFRQKRLKTITVTQIVQQPTLINKETFSLAW